MPDNKEPERVVILGGGIGAITTAFWLTSTPELRKQYKVSVYSHGWRLGGKAASGRNAEHSERIQEHGLHMLMGWYEIAFRTMRACYAEWEKKPENPFQTWSDAFEPLRQVTLTQRVPDEPNGTWQKWNLKFPKLPGTPGETTEEIADNVVHKILTWLREHLWHGLELPESLEPSGLESLAKAHEEAGRTSSIPVNGLEAHHNLLLDTLKEFQKWFQKLAEPVLTHFHSEGVKICAVTDYALAVAIGFVRDVLPDWDKGLEKLNEIEFRDWLLSAGANPKYTGYAPVRVLYDLSFAYKNGDSSTIENGRIAAGSGLRALLMMTFAYKDAPLWKMKSGMGDTIFTPLYEVLRKRGVDIHLFHRLTKLQLSADASEIDSISMYRQVDLVDGTYDPLYPLKLGKHVLPVWPSHPDWKQIVGGKSIAPEAWDLESMWCTYRPPGKTDVNLKRGEDFDIVVLGIPPASLPDFGQELIDRCSSIAKMHDNTNSVATLASQLWLEPDLKDLGWSLGPTVLSAYANPFRSWGEMSHLIPMEKWTSPKPGSCEYFCGTLVPPKTMPPYGDSDFLLQQTERVHHDFNSWLRSNITTLWPDTSAKGGGFNDSLLVSQYYRVNLDPSELYVQTFPKTVKHRLAPGESGVRNLYLAGDWTKGKVNGGCAEGAFESGKMAAEAICGHPLDLPLD